MSEYQNFERWFEANHSSPFEPYDYGKKAEMWSCWQAARSQGGEVEPVAEVVSGYTGDPDTVGDKCLRKLDLSKVRIGDKLYTHPPAPTQGVPDGWRETMKDLADDLESEIEARRSGELDRRIERDLTIVREARALLATSADSQPPKDKQEGSDDE